MLVSAHIDPDTEAGRYMLACARIRQVGLSALVHRLISTISTEQLVLAVLDDDSRVVHNHGEHTVNHRKEL